MSEDDRVAEARSRMEKQKEEIQRSYEEAIRKPGFLHDGWTNVRPHIPGPGELALGIFYDPDRYKPKSNK